MNVEELTAYCMGMKGATDCFPFDEVTLVFKVQGKMFALIPLDNPDLQIALKCDPDLALQYRETYGAITPARHFNKQYWNSVRIAPEISHDFLCEMIRHSYDLVVAGLPKKLREGLNS